MNFVNTKKVLVKSHYRHDNTVTILKDKLIPHIKDNTIIVCIGTDRCIGDALAPLVGSKLKQSSLPLPVYGTLRYPIHAINLRSELLKIEILHGKPHIIAIDACLGDEPSIGYIQIRNSPVYPGRGVGKNLPSVGDLSMVGIVDKYDKDDLLSFHSIRLSLIIDMADVLSEAIIMATEEAL